MLMIHGSICTQCCVSLRRSALHVRCVCLPCVFWQSLCVADSSALCTPVS